MFNFEALVFQKDRLMGWISDVSKRVIKPSGECISLQFTDYCFQYCYLGNSVVGFMVYSSS